MMSLRIKLNLKPGIYRTVSHCFITGADAREQTLSADNFGLSSHCIGID
jgi:hypothetical protein